jgi:hypothetical protein
VILLVTVFDVYDLPAICKVTLLDIFSEGNGRVAVDGNIWESLQPNLRRQKGPDERLSSQIWKQVRECCRSNDRTHSNKVSELQMTRETARLTRDTFHQTAIPKDCYSVKSQWKIMRLFAAC